jgi:drug/metabolite transporter (DMT)-like permease
VSSYSGEIAALITAFCYAASSTFFTAAGKRFGSIVANRARLITAALLLVIVHWIGLGEPLPLSAEPNRWFWLGLSGIVGLALGDAFLFQAYVSIGPRLGLLLLSLAPAVATFLAWLFLGERLGPGKLLGIAITLAGIIWVVLVRRSNGNGSGKTSLAEILHDRQYRLGLLFGIAAAFGQALGLTLAKMGLGGDFPALSANVIRMTIACLAFWALTILQKQVGATIQKVRSAPQGLWFILGGSIIGPVVGVSLSLYAIQHTTVGVASTIIALPPVILLPVSRFILKEQFGWGAVWGTLLAVCGVAILFLL